jgi:L-alanine-DL-glutamate epimerase-like enolase superfamily enzyme
MHIDSLSIFHVALPRKTPKIIAGRPCETLETVLVKLSSGDAVGWGEAAPGNAPTGTSEWAAGAFAVLRDWLAPTVVKTEIESGKTLAERLAPFRGNQYAKAALDIAWWDLSARMQERPLHELLGANLPSPPAPLPVGEGSNLSPPAPIRKTGEGSNLSPPAPIRKTGEGSNLSPPAPIRKTGEGSNQPSPPAPLPEGEGRSVEVGPCLDQMESPDAFMAAIGAAFEAGFRRVKLKIRPGWALDMLRSVRQEFPGERFHIDCEGALNLSFSEMLYRFDDFALEMVEQPLAAEDLVAHAMLQESLRTPICLDESIAAPLHAEMALDLKSCRHVNLKAGRVGGLTAALEILGACQAAEVSCWGGASAQSAVGARADLNLTACTNSDYPADFFPSASELAEDLAEPLHPLRDARDGAVRIVLAAGPGLGAVPDAALLEKFLLQKAEI